jgi:hypothetical protein
MICRPFRAFVAIALIAASGSGARADSPKAEPLPPPAKEEVSIQRWGVANRDCGEWTNACQVCLRDAAGRPQCSTPGIACQPKAIQCLRKPAP